MSVTLEVSKLSGWLNADAYCRASNGGHAVWAEVQSTGSGRRWRATAVHAWRAGEGSTADWEQGTGRCAPRVPWPPAFTAGPSPCTPLAPPSPHAHPRLAHPASHRTVCLSRQGASAFNQPLNFDTSSVTNMFGMFYVRSSPCPTCPDMQSSPPLHAACTAVGRHLRPPGLHLALHRMPFFRLSPGRVGVQPAAELRHVQRHRHAPHVLLRVGVQPAAELRHVQRYGHE